MLVLSRKRKEGILIDGGRITVRVASIEGDTVKLAIDAPREVEIVREELYQSVQQSNQASAQQPTGANGLAAFAKQARQKRDR